MITSIDLTDAEWNSLQELRKGPLRKQIPLPHAMKLINLGFAKRLFESIVATDEGRRLQRKVDVIGGAARVERRPRSLKLVTPVIWPPPLGSPA
jgi:hypothetical protein